MAIPCRTRSNYQDSPTRSSTDQSWRTTGNFEQLTSLKVLIRYQLYRYGSNNVETILVPVILAKFCSRRPHARNYVWYLEIHWLERDRCSVCCITLLILRLNRFRDNWVRIGLFRQCQLHISTLGCPCVTVMFLSCLIQLRFARKMAFFCSASLITACSAGFYQLAVRIILIRLSVWFCLPLLSECHRFSCLNAKFSCYHHVVLHHFASMWYSHSFHRCDSRGAVCSV